MWSIQGLKCIGQCYQSGALELLKYILHRELEIGERLFDIYRLV